MIVSIIAILVFSAAFGVATFAIALSVLPRLDRIAEALAGRPMSVPAQVRAERRLAVRRWSEAGARPVRGLALLTRRAAA